MKTFKEYFNQNVLIESVSEAEALKYKSAEEFVKARQVPDARIPDSFEFSSPNASKYYYGNKTQQFLEKARTERVSEITMPKDSIVHRGEASGESVSGNWYSADRGEAEGYAGSGIVRSLNVSGKKFATFDKYLPDEPTQLSRQQIEKGLQKAIKDGYDGLYNTGDNALLIPSKSQLIDIWNKAHAPSQSSVQIPKTATDVDNINVEELKSLTDEAKKYKTAEEFVESKNELFRLEYNYRKRLPNVRGGWTKDKIRKTLKHITSESSQQAFYREIMKFNSAKELGENMFYHGSSSGIGGLKPSITMSEREAAMYGGGGYGERYWGISLSKDRNIASNFASQSSFGNVAPVILKKGAIIKAIPNIQDANEVEDIITELWNEGVDAVKIGDWKDRYSEQELVVLNPRAIVVGRSEHFQVFNKKRMESFNEETINKMYEDSIINYEREFIKNHNNRNEKYKEKYGKELSPLGESKYSKHFKAKQRLTDIWNKAQRNNI